MARQPTNVKPYLKHMESYNNFSGGLNTVTTIENLRNNEFPDLTNIDLGERGSLKRRYGMKRVLDNPSQGLAQGYFRFYKEDGTYDEIQAIDGKLYKNREVLPIEGIDTFQTERMIEAVQFREKLWIATGTKLVEYDGETAKVVEPYKPEPLEALYIGTNGLADNPSQYLEDGEAAYLRIEGVIPNRRYGIVNKPTYFDIYVSKPVGSTVEYQFHVRKAGDTNWLLWREFTINSRTEFSRAEAGEWEMKFTARVQGEEHTEEYHLPSYRINANDENETVPNATIHNSTRILLHHDRLILYGDPNQGDVIYISHLNEPSYFPSPYTLQFENEKKEGITSLVRFRDMLVVFTRTSIQGLYGKAPIGDDTYRRIHISNAIGCIAPKSAKVMGNYVTFLSQEGMHILKSLSFSEDRMNVEKIDSNIDNILPRHEDACSVVQGLQYHITFPQIKKRFRFYYEQGTWTKDESEHLDFVEMYNFDGECYGLGSLNVLYRFDPTVWDDDGHVYEDYIKTKDFNFGLPYNPKKLKELQMVFGHYTEPVHLTLSVYADSAIVVNPNKSHAVIEDNYVVWKEIIEPNVELLPGTRLGVWQMSKDAFGNTENQVQRFKISGKCRQTRVEIRHKQATPNQFFSLGYIYKIKNP